MLRSQCCRRHRRKIQSIDRLSPPVIIASVPFVDSRRCHRRRHRRCNEEEEEEEEEQRGQSRERDRDEEDRGINEQQRRRRRVCRSRLGGRCCDWCPARRLRCSTTSRLASFDCSRPKPAGIFASREELRARRALVSFVLFLPVDDDLHDLLPPLYYDPWPRWIAT